ncbi:MAG: PilZ domain-containing protein [Terriglobia bacterium]|jgi:hypothetical protein
MSQSAASSPPENKRGSERVLLRIPIRVEGKTLAGTQFTEETFTIVINRNGARIRLKHLVRPNEELRITNLQTRMSCSFRVVGRTSPSLTEGPEWGVECLEPSLNFWGIFFPKIAAAPTTEETVDTLLECSVCRFRELASLTLEHYRYLITHSSLNRRCPRCRVGTDWRFGFAEEETEEPYASQVQAGAAAPQGIEGRRSKRMTVKLPVRIRAEGGREEIAKTENLSRTGVCFVCEQEMKVGEIIKLTVGYAPGTNETEITARVMWRRPLEGQTRALYGVQLEEAALP